MTSILVTGILAGAGMAVWAAQEPRRVIAAANVALRAEPSTTSAVVGHLTLGTEAVELASRGDDDVWYRVRVSSSREGWVLGRLTRAIPSGQRMATLEALIVERLARTGDSFSATVELVDFVERLLQEAAGHEAPGRLTWYRLRALANTLSTIRRYRNNGEPVDSWLASRRDGFAVFNEPGGSWMLDPALIRRLRDRYRSTKAGDEIAWLAVTTGLGGECEGYLLCYVDRMRRESGEYLRLYPSGQYADRALEDLARRTRSLTEESLPPDAFDRARCTDLLTGIDELRGAVDPTTGAGRQAALAGIDSLRVWCR